MSITIKTSKQVQVVTDPSNPVDVNVTSVVTPSSALSVNKVPSTGPPVITLSGPIQNQLTDTLFVTHMNALVAAGYAAGGRFIISAGSTIIPAGANLGRGYVWVMMLTQNP